MGRYAVWARGGVKPLHSKPLTGHVGQGERCKCLREYEKPGIISDGRSREEWEGFPEEAGVRSIE